jgi:hypothetical protein
MHKRTKRASLPLESDGSHDIPNSQKKHYEMLGYKPYLSYKGKIKWLSFEQHIYEKIKYAHSKHSHVVKKGHRYGRRRSNIFVRLFRLIANNWLFILVFLLLIAFMYRYNAIISLVSKF